MFNIQMAKCHSQKNQSKQTLVKIPERGSNPVCPSSGYGLKMSWKIKMKTYQPVIADGPG